MRKTVHEPVAHLVKRVDMDRKKAWLIRLIAFALSILACAIISPSFHKSVILSYLTISYLHITTNSF